LHFLEKTPKPKGLFANILVLFVSHRKLLHGGSQDTDAGHLLLAAEPTK
jgi:hypothetical protein